MGTVALVHCSVAGLDMTLQTRYSCPSDSSTRTFRSVVFPLKTNWKLRQWEVCVATGVKLVASHTTD